MSQDASVGRSGSPLFAQPGYRRLWAARTVSQLGDLVQFTTLALLVLHLTGSGVGVSGAVLAEVVPLVVLAPLAGILVDRVPRVATMVVADIARMVFAAALAVWHGNLAVAYLVAFGLSAGSAFFNPAAGSLLPSLVRDDQLVAANSAIWSAAVLSQIALAPAAGVLVATLGYAPAFAFNAATFAVSASALTGLRVGEANRQGVTASMWSQARQGFAVVTGDKLLRAMAAAQCFAALSAGATSALLVVLVRQRLHASSAGYGLALAAIGVGAFFGPVILTHLRIRQHHARLVFAAFGLRGAVDLALATITALPAILGALVAYGLGTSTGNVSFSSLIQTHVHDEHRGRVFSTFDLIWHSARLLSIAAGGAIADGAGIRAIYFLGGGLLLAAALTGITATRWHPDRQANAT